MSEEAKASIDRDVARRKLDREVLIDLWPDAGILLNRSRNGMYSAARDGSIPVIRIGRNLKVPTAPLRRLLGIEPEAA